MYVLSIRLSHDRLGLIDRQHLVLASTGGSISLSVGRNEQASSAPLSSFGSQALSISKGHTIPGKMVGRLSQTGLLRRAMTGPIVHCLKTQTISS